MSFNIKKKWRTFRGLENYHKVRKQQAKWDEIKEKVKNKSVMCEDGKVRRIVEISEPVLGNYQRKDRIAFYIINENDPQSDMGHWVHKLDVVSAMEGHPPPTQEARDAATRLWTSMVLADPKSLYKQTVSGKSPISVEE